MGELAFERQPYTPCNICKRLQESIVRVNNCGNMPGSLKVSPAIYLGFLIRLPKKWAKARFFY
jgi:hypothetical protein